MTSAMRNTALGALLNNKGVLRVPIELIACRDAVYCWVRGDNVLYIGMSGTPMRRIGMHQVIGIVEPLAVGDEVLVIPCEDGKVFALEAELIRLMKPKYNDGLAWDQRTKECEQRVCLSCGKTFMQKRNWQRWCSRKCGTGVGRYSKIEKVSK